ncbi:MAG: FAD-dependent oxidoreductase [Planctomycetota bacterium]
MHESTLSRDLPSLMRAEATAGGRSVREVALATDLVVVGGGIAGLCAAISAARQGIKVVLIQDRPVLGGNASSEVRLWLLGATVHMGSNNRWAREGGIVGEIYTENLWRNPEGNPLIFDSILLEWAVREANLHLLLNTAVDACAQDASGRITSVTGFCAQNSTRYVASAPLFCDASGDGVLGFCAGAPFRMGAEARDEFGEANAPGGEFGRLLGHSIYFYAKDVGRPVNFVAPAFALTDITKIPRWKSFDAKTMGCRLWWIEWGGRFDTVHDTEAIKWELWKVVYGVWNHIKNSGLFPDAANLTLEWVGHIPGKRESRRFEGAHILTQQDIIERRHHQDVVAHGGWSIDLHPADGVYSAMPGSFHLQSKSVYGIPYRCYYSRTVPNLFMAGRIISTTHVAFGSTRVMATCGVGGQAVGTAAAICHARGLDPAAITADPKLVSELQRRLLRTGQFLPGVALSDPDDLVPSATVTASSTLQLAELPPDGPWAELDHPRAQLLPAIAGAFPAVRLWTKATQPTRIRIELRQSERAHEHCPEIVLAHRDIDLPAGEAEIGPIDFGVVVDQTRHIWLMLPKTDGVSVRESELRVTGVLALWQRRWHTDAKDDSGKLCQQHLGGEDFTLYVPRRRPEGLNLALRLTSPLSAFSVANLSNGVDRPMAGANAWVAAPTDPAPSIQLAWSKPQAVARVEIACDVDFDHAMETVLLGHPERAVPFCARTLLIRDGAGSVLAKIDDNRMGLVIIDLPSGTIVNQLTIAIEAMHGPAPAALFGVRCFAARATTTR